jgi:anthraniloyl-CoA monooxygenase
MQKNDPQSRPRRSAASFAYWDDIAVVHDGTRTVSGGHGFAGIGRKQMLILLQARARELGVDLRFETEFKTAEDYRKDYDLVVASTGSTRWSARNMPRSSSPTSTSAWCKFVWLGTHQKFDDAFTFIFEKTEHGWVWAHVYQFDDNTATFIVECLPETWDAGASPTCPRRRRSRPAARSFERIWAGMT